ncbi:FAD-dependent oxidoreductase [Nocardioides sp. zg-DK7169]|uniref:FAD-dependent oxidoreductase n=1 Tax=Nocardioides sp. zg-DK7169 TaxID=2736600 RepID=UPI0015567A84|nr:FAD-dependent oxidoreductase [Nocardioides sp. zg-DK7169]NPC98250.1 NAD(P)/FAD-dependent oxidoreductase [Nocardioides sp. zg-DK7169]
MSLDERASLDRRVVVVGAGMAAARLADALADAGRHVTLLGDEPHPPYNRILLSAVLEGTHDPAALELGVRDTVDLRLGTRVVDIHREEREVELADRSRVGYDALVLATGAIPTLPPIRGLVRPDGRLHEKVHAFRSLADCERLDAAVGVSTGSTTAGSAVVVGGGLLGLQVARALSVRGLAVEVVEGGEHLLRSQVEERAGRIIARDLTRLGATVYTGARAVRLTEDGLVLDNGYTLETDLVVLTAGDRPSTALARRAGLEVRRGVVVDERLRTSDEHIYAIGDCAQRGGTVTGFVPPAWEQAAVLARHLAGEEASYDPGRHVVRLRATGLDVAVLGDPVHAEGEVVEVTNPVVGSHRRLVVDGGRIVAGTLVGDLSRIGLITQHFDRGTVLGANEPGLLLMPDRATAAAEPQLPDDAEVCSCAGVSAGAVRACASLDEVRATTRATTGCGGCSDAVRRLLDTRSTLLEGTPR